MGDNYTPHPSIFYCIRLTYSFPMRRTERRGVWGTANPQEGVHRANIMPKKIWRNPIDKFDE